MSPAANAGEPPSTRIAVNGPAPPPVAVIPEPPSVAVAVRVSGRLDQPSGTPLRRVTGSVLSTRTIALPAAAERIPDPETATAWT